MLVPCTKGIVGQDSEMARIKESTTKWDVLEHIYFYKREAVLMFTGHHTSSINQNSIGCKIFLKDLYFLLGHMHRCSGLHLALCPGITPGSLSILLGGRNLTRLCKCKANMLFIITGLEKRLLKHFPDPLQSLLHP